MHSSEAITANEAAVIQTLADYYKAFSTLVIDAIVPYFQNPALVLAPSGALALPDQPALTSFLERVAGDLRSRGYGRSEYDLESIKPLGSADAIVNGIAIRYKTDGQELERVDIAYLMHKSEAGWKIAAMILVAPAPPKR